MTIIIIFITIAVSLYALSKPDFNYKLIHNPYLVKHNRQWYRLVTSGLLHADFIHLFVNMFVLYSFGRVVEFYYSGLFGAASWLIYLLLYFTAIYASSAASQYKHQDNPQYNSLGASGAVSAVLFTAILFEPFEPLYLYGIVKIPGIVFGLLYLGYSYYMSKKQIDQVNHDAHFYGAIYGIVFTLVLKPQVGLAFLGKFLGN